MKRAVSISLGSSTRDAEGEITLLGERIHVERIGTDGDMERAARLFEDLDGKVDAFGLGGADLGLQIAETWYPLHSVRPVVRFVKHTPLVDGTAVKRTLERRVAAVVRRELGAEIGPGRVLLPVMADRWDMALAFAQAGFECVFGDLMFALGIPVPLRSADAVRRLATVVMPVLSRVPFRWIYPTGRKQEEPQPKFEKWFRWATVIAGDSHYIRQRLPARLDGKVICTNTTTREDVDRFRAAGVRYLVTATPPIGDRTFGANVLEAALVAASGHDRALTGAEVSALIDRERLEPTIRRLAGAD